MKDEVMSSAEHHDLNGGKVGERSARTDVRVYTTANAELGVVTVPEDLPVCWICLDGATPAQALFKPCGCPRMAHPTCVARWQLQSAGTRKETHCEFCDQELPDWKRTLTPQCGANAPAVMNVNFDGRTYSFEVKPGVDGYRQFTEAIRKAFSLPEDSELNITFTCDEPIAMSLDSQTSGLPPPAPGPVAMEEAFSTPSSPSGSLLTLQGAGAYDAAVHCASVSAARRIMQSSLPSSPHYPGSQQGTSFRQPVQGDPRTLRPFSPGTPPLRPSNLTEEGTNRRNHTPSMFQKAVRKLTGRRSNGDRNGDKSGERSD